MKVYACQFDIAWEDKAANHAKVTAMLDAATFEPDSLVILPEMFATGFSMNAAVTTDSVTRESEQFVAATAQRLGVYLMAGFVVDGRNEAVTYGPDGKLVARYGKLHPFTLGGEKAAYNAGTEVVLFPWQGFTVAPFICYDLRFPEIFRVATRRGANLIVVIANWPKRRVSHWLALLKARAIENQAYVVGLNRCGNDPTLEYSGDTQIIDPSGAVIAAAQGEETFVTADLDLAVVDEYRAQLPFLADIRTDFLIT